MFDPKALKVLGVLVSAALLTLPVVAAPQKNLQGEVPAAKDLKVSKGEQAQTETPKLDTAGEAMPGSQSEPAKEGALGQVKVAPKVLTRPGGQAQLPTVKPQGVDQGMEKLLANPQTLVRGDLPPVSQVPTAPTVTSGGQLEPRLARPGQAGESYLSLVLRVGSNGTSEVVSATEIPGSAPLSDEPKGDFLYEVRLGGRAVAVEALSDPFEIHAFGGPPGTPQALHHFQRQEEATVVVKVPKAKLDSSLADLSFQLFKLESGAPLERVNPEVLDRLKQDKRLKSLVLSSPQELAPQIRQQGLTLQPEVLQIQR